METEGEAARTKATKQAQTAYVAEDRKKVTQFIVYEKSNKSQSKINQKELRK